MPKPGPRTTYRYSRDFKATAVRLSELPGVAVRDVAESLYIHPFMLSRWRKQAREGLRCIRPLARVGALRRLLIATLAVTGETLARAGVLVTSPLDDRLSRRVLRLAQLGMREIDWAHGVETMPGRDWKPLPGGYSCNQGEPPGWNVARNSIVVTWADYAARFTTGDVL
jgi:transposase-like protein